MSAHSSLIFEPISESHAIEDVVFLLDFVEPVSLDGLMSIITRHSEIEKNYPFYDKHVGLLTGIPSKDIFSPVLCTPREVMIGIQFYNQIPFQASTSSVFVGDGIRINFSEYVGWNKNSSTALSIIDFLLNILSPQITRINLAYRDVFKANKWNDSIDKEAALAALFKTTSKYLPSNILHCSFPWHSHHGFFENRENGQYKILNNINTGLICRTETSEGKDSGSSEVYISTEINCIFDKPAQDISIESMRDIFEILHSQCKDVIKDLLTEEMLKSIGIQDEQQSV